MRYEKIILGRIPCEKAPQAVRAWLNVIESEICCRKGFILSSFSCVGIPWIVCPPQIVPQVQVHLKLLTSLCRYPSAQLKHKHILMFWQNTLDVCKQYPCCLDGYYVASMVLKRILAKIRQQSIVLLSFSTASALVVLEVSLALVLSSWIIRG